MKRRSPKLRNGATPASLVGLGEPLYEKLSKARREANAADRAKLPKGRETAIITARMLLIGGMVAYNSWVREAGYQKDARIKKYEKLPAHMHTRWERIAADVFKAMGAA